MQFFAQRVESGQGQNCQRTYALAEFLVKVKSVAGGTTLMKNLCAVSLEPCRSVVPESVHQARPLLRPHCDVKIEPGSVGNELATRRTCGCRKCNTSGASL
jgi:hypothetical protein